MDNILIGTVVKNQRGHDGEKLFVVVLVEGEYLYLANGKRRTFQKPKKKNRKHIIKTTLHCDLRGISTDKGLRRYLKNVTETIYKGGCDLG